MKNNRERKPTRLKEYNYSNNGVYFITICAKSREHIFSEITVKKGNFGIVQENTVPENHLTDIGRIAEKYILSANSTKGVNIDNYVIMPNHIHLLLRIADNNREMTDGEREGMMKKRPSGTSGAPSPTNYILPRVVAGFKRLVNKEVGENVFQRSYRDRMFVMKPNTRKFMNILIVM